MSARRLSAGGRAAAFFLLAALPFGFLLAAPPLAAGQAPATLVVRVQDNTGVLPGASVVIINRADGVRRQALAGDEGTARFEGVTPGVYDVRASLPGFADAERPQVIVSPDAEQAIDVTLSVVQFSTSVTVTTASRREELLMEVADPTTLIDRTQIEDSGARTAKDLLVEQAGSGVQVQAGGGQGHVSLNGIPNSGVLVLLDGRRYLGKDANGNLNLEDIQLAGIDRVEIVKGAASALYGSDALGGVINLITRKTLEPGVRNSLSATAGSYDDVRVSDTLGYRRGPAGFTVTGNYRTYDGFDLDASNPQTIGQPESRFSNAGGTADLRLGTRVDLRLFGDYSRRKISNYFFSGPTQLPSTVYDSRRDLTRYTVSPELTVLARPGTSVTASFTYGRYDRDETQVFPTREAVVVPWREWNREVKATGRHDWTLFGQIHPLQVGYEFRDETLDRASLRTTSGAARASREINVGWLQQEVRVGSRLKLTGGFRFDSYSDFGSSWSPKFSAVYGATPRHSVRASYGHGFRAPFFGELFLSTPTFVGNPDLEPERSRTMSAGYTFGGSLAQLSADYFRARVEDGITFDLRRLPFTYRNLREYTSQGVNLSASVQLPGGFVPTASYAYVHREDQDGAEVGGLPTHSAFLKLLWASPRWGLRANLRGQILNEARFEDGTSQPAYQVWSAQVNKTLVTRGRTSFGVFVQADNLFDKRDIFRRSVDDEPIPGDYQVWLAPRTFLTGVTIELAR
jgi:outer membrane receptor for ferrienterochelin and colicins